MTPAAFFWRGADFNDSIAAEYSSSIDKKCKGLSMDRCDALAQVPYTGSANTRKNGPNKMARKRKYGTLGGTLDEPKSGKFFGNAQMRSSRRKSPWNLMLLLALPLWIILFLEGLKLARFLATGLRHGPKPMFEDLIWPGSIAPFFVYFPLLIATIVPAMVLINYAVYLFIPQARRAMDAEDKAFPGTEYATQQPLLVRITLYSLPPAFVLSVIGSLFI